MRMQKRFAQHMQVNIVGKWSDFIHHVTKLVHAHKLHAAPALITKTAMKVTLVTYFYVDFFEMHSVRILYFQPKQNF